MRSTFFPLFKALLGLIKHVNQVWQKLSSLLCLVCLLTFVYWYFYILQKYQGIFVVVDSCRIYASAYNQCNTTTHDIHMQQARSQAYVCCFVGVEWCFSKSSLARTEATQLLRSLVPLVCLFPHFFCTWDFLSIMPPPMH